MPDTEPAFAEDSSETLRLSIDTLVHQAHQVDVLLGNPTKAKEVLKWNPTQTPFVKLVQEMVDADVELYATGRQQNA